MQINDEDISALLDGETATRDTTNMADLLHEPAAREQWSRYSLVGDVIRDRDTVIAPPDFARKLSEIIEAEPTVLAPRAQSSSTRLRPLVGFAIAASVAALAVIGVQTLGPPTDNPANTAVASRASVPEATPVSSEIETTAVFDPGADTARLHSQRRLNSYLVKFNEQRSSLGVPSVNPYVRIVGFESE